MKSCMTCPSYMDDQAAIADRFGREVGGPVCGRFGTVLGRPNLGQDNFKEVAKFIGESCDSHGEPLAAIPVSIEPLVARPTSASPPDTEGEKVPPSCMGCKFYVPQPAVFEETGWTTAACAAKGRLIFSPLRESKGCEYKTIGANSSMSAIRLSDHFGSSFKMADQKVIESLIDLGGANGDPRQYETDREVSEQDRQQGIRAWRAVMDPEGWSSDPVYLPIFDDSAFAPEDQLLIPRFGDDQHPELFIDYAGLLYTFAVDSYELGETLCLIGEPGLGKTEFGRYVAFLMNKPFVRFSFNKASETDDMIGKMKFDTERGTYWVDGRITKAYQSNVVAMLDELNLSPEECKELLRSMMDNSSQLVLDQDEGVIVSQHPFFNMLVSINPPWDFRNIGAEEFADAEVNRMSFASVSWPPEQVEAHIIRERCKLDGDDIPENLVDKLIAIAKDLREAADQGTFPGSWGIRQQIKVARKTRRYDLVRAYKRAALDYYDPSVVNEAILPLIASHGG